MFLEAVFERFVKKSPVSVMARALLEHALDAKALDALFGKHAEHQYEKTLLFSSVVDLMALVVCKIQPSVCAAYQAVQDTLPVSLAAVYGKLDGIEGVVTAALVNYAAARLGAVVEQMRGQLPPLLPGYRIRIVDGNHFAATQHRLAVLRETKAGPLPAQALAILDPLLMLVTHMIPCEDAHAQERSLFSSVLALVQALDCWIADRNFCTVGFLYGILHRDAFFIIRQHAKFPIASYGTLHYRGRCKTGAVWEQSVTFIGEDEKPVEIRRIVICLDKPTKDGETEVAVLTNVPAKDANAVRIAELYLERWTVEEVFLTLTQILDGEIPSLGYPKAALFGFGIALVSFNVASTMRAALRATYGCEKVEREVSWYYVANEVRVTSGGMDVALDAEVWKPFQEMSAGELAGKLLEYASYVRLPSFKRHPRGPKKPAPPRTKYRGQPHVSTARLLARAGHPS